MIPTKYLTIAKWIAIASVVGTVYVTIRNHGHAIAENKSLHDKLDIEIESRKQAEALADDLSEKLQQFQRIDQERERQVADARRRTDAAMRELQAVPRDSAFGVCLNTPVPDELANRVSEAAEGLQLPD